MLILVFDESRMNLFVIRKNIYCIYKIRRPIMDFNFIEMAFHNHYGFNYKVGIRGSGYYGGGELQQ